MLTVGGAAAGLTNRNSSSIRNQMSYRKTCGCQSKFGFGTNTYSFVLQLMPARKFFYKIKQMLVVLRRVLLGIRITYTSSLFTLRHGWNYFDRKMNAPCIIFLFGLTRFNFWITCEVDTNSLLLTHSARVEKQDHVLLLKFCFWLYLEYRCPECQEILVTFISLIHLYLSDSLG